MADAPSGGMDKSAMKTLLMRSKKEPVNVALGQQKDAVLILLDKIKQPKALVKALEKDAGDLKNTRFGTAFVDVDEDPKLVILTLNRAAPGLAAKAKKTLKGTGFSKVEIRLEDGTVAEAVGEEEEEGAQPGATPEAPVAAQPDATVEPPEPDAAPDAAQPDMGALTRRLTEAAKRMKGAPDPSRQDSLLSLANEAQAAIKSGDAQAAERAVDTLERALDQPAGAGDAAPPAEPAALPANMAAFGKARQAWVATRRKVEDELDKLHKQMTDHYSGHGFAAELDKVFQSKVEPVLANLDDSLSDKLDEVTKNSDPAAHAKLVEDAKGVISRYQSYLSSDPIIAKLDSNPFVPLAIQKTLTATLAALSKAVH